MFDGFRLDDIAVASAVLRVRWGGTGPPVLLLHGHPRTHTTWCRVAPLLAQQHSVVCPDLRGYGRSSKPVPDLDHRKYSKRAMAQDCLELMRHLGHDRFAVVGHDRGAYVAFRIAMDHPGVVSSLSVLDAVPIGEALSRCDATFAARWWHWFFLGNPSAQAHHVINADPERWYRTHGKLEHMDPDNLADLLDAVRDTATVRAMCEDYRAGLTVDRAHDDADRVAGARLRCPVQVLWAERDDLEDLYGDPLDVWRAWGTDVSGARLPTGHHMAEEAPELLAAAIVRFVAASDG